MANIVQNQAAWQQAKFDKDFIIASGPDQTHPADDEIVIKVAYVAIAPSEWKIQDLAYIDLEYPHVLGTDAAGIVVLTGSKVTRFKPGDRVIGYCLGLIYGGSKHGAFQNYTTIRERAAVKLPDSIALSRGVVLPMAVFTSTVGLFEHLQLGLPNLTRHDNGETIVIWGASSSVGSIAIQLAHAAGYEVVTTASRHNHGYAKELGAARVFDYADAQVVQKMQQYLRGKQLAGIFDCIGEETTTRACADILSESGGGVLPTVLWPPENLPENVKVVMVWAFRPGTEDDYGASSVWTNFVPAALRTGVLQPKPESYIMTGGLERLQEALDLQKKGVSAKKIVVEIDSFREQ
ncbi:hypothetical protein LTR56_005568 [Elasticomyces elasticus]|nr:hypothetical protein LTR22_017155 [Elasticomyces elasticus]KAK3651760.1 hypothetical protein LTR56_005568 [Elasticomyces elasticus]KAK4913335.1 hypothetical protein LTR49_018316 [Elasticomyces elasticus]KAK5769141.1 hypothetical protein LTS12_000492 [Elasticomyces elasticus]